MKSKNTTPHEELTVSMNKADFRLIHTGIQRHGARSKIFTKIKEMRIVKRGYEKTIKPKNLWIELATGLLGYQLDEHPLIITRAMMHNRQNVTISGITYSFLMADCRSNAFREVLVSKDPVEDAAMTFECINDPTHTTTRWGVTDSTRQDIINAMAVKGFRLQQAER